MPGLAISDAAAARLLAMAQQRGTPAAGLRIAVRGGGCSGLTYVMEWSDLPSERDRVFEHGGARVFVDSKSLLYLGGSELTYEETLVASGFKIQNPNAKASCGCGESFTT